MNEVQAWLTYLISHPLIAAAAGAAVLIVLYLLNRKPRLEREAEVRMKQLRSERGGKYDNLRPLN